MGRYRAADKDEGAQPSAGRIVRDAIVMTLLAPLPDAWRAAVEDRLYFNANSVALPSSLLQFAVGVTTWAIFLLRFVHSQLDAVAEAVQKLPEGYRNEALIYGQSYSVLGNPLTVVVYTLTTLPGFLSAVTIFGAFVRFAGLPGGWENHPDPTLNLIEWLRRKFIRGAERRDRERQKGDVTPDIVTANDGSAGWHLRIVSRDEHAWHEGASVFVDGVHYRLIGKFETRDDKARLRLAYELRRCEPTDVIRGHATYPPRVSVPPHHVRT